MVGAMTDFAQFLALPLAKIGGTVVTLGQSLACLAGLLLFLLAALAVSLWRSASARAYAAADAAQRARETDARMAGIQQAQAEMQGRMSAVADTLGARQGELNQSIGQRLDAMTGRIGQTMAEQTRSTHENLARLQERLAVIDSAQNNIRSLAGQVVQLQAILSNKQTRGAFGQARMEAIVADGLPQGAYTFQETLSNGSRPDCTVKMPNGAPSLVIDAKFPLEAWNAIRARRKPIRAARRTGWRSKRSGATSTSTSGRSPRNICSPARPTTRPSCSCRRSRSSRRSTRTSSRSCSAPTAPASSSSLRRC